MPRCDEVRLGFRLIAESPIRHCQRIVDDGRQRIDRQRLFEILDSLGVVLLRQRDAAEAVLRGHRTWLKRERLREMRLRFSRLPVVEIAFADPDERGHVVRLQLQRAPERRGRLGAVALQLVKMSEVVRPSCVAWTERLRVEQRRFGFAAVLGRHEQHAHLSVGEAELLGRH